MLQVLPRVRPCFCGVGDAALALAAALAASGRLSHLIVTEPNHPPPTVAEGVSAVHLSHGVDGLAAALAAAPPGPVLLHYHAYAFSPDGRPMRVLPALLRAVGRRPLAVWFHEIAASDDPPWRRGFWRAGGQRRAARLLAQRAATVATSCTVFAALLAAWRGAAVDALPVASTVGEPAEVVPPAARESVAVAFGAAPTRARLARHGAALGRALKAAGIHELWEIGVGPSQLRPTRLGLPVRALGALDGEALAARLQAARLGVLDYPVVYGAKSSVLAAYAAYGLVPVLAAPGRRDGTADGLTAGVHYLPLEQAAVAADPARAAALAAAVRSWYCGHTWAMHAAAWAARFDVLGASGLALAD